MKKEGKYTLPFELYRKAGESGLNVRLWIDYLEGFDTSARVALMKGNREVSYAVYIRHKYMDGEVFETLGFAKNELEVWEGGKYKPMSVDSIVKAWSKSVKRHQRSEKVVKSHSNGKVV